MLFLRVRNVPDGNPVSRSVPAVEEGSDPLLTSVRRYTRAGVMLGKTVMEIHKAMNQLYGIVPPQKVNRESDRLHTGGI